MFRKAIDPLDASSVEDPQARPTALAVLQLVAAQQPIGPEQEREVVSLCSPAHRGNWAAVVRSYNSCVQAGGSHAGENAAGLAELRNTISDLAGRPIDADREIAPVMAMGKAKRSLFGKVGKVSIKDGRPVVQKSRDFHFYVVTPFAGTAIPAAGGTAPRLMILGTLQQLGDGDMRNRQQGMPLVELRPSCGDPRDRLLEAKVRLDEPEGGFAARREWFQYTVVMEAGGRYITESGSNGDGWREIAMNQTASFVPRVDFAYSALGQLALLADIAWSSPATPSDRAMLLIHCCNTVASEDEKSDSYQALETFLRADSLIQDRDSDQDVVLSLLQQNMASAQRFRNSFAKSADDKAAHQSLQEVFLFLLMATPKYIQVAGHENAALGLDAVQLIAAGLNYEDDVRIGLQRLSKTGCAALHDALVQYMKWTIQHGLATWLRSIPLLNMLHESQFGVLSGGTGAGDWRDRPPSVTTPQQLAEELTHLAASKLLDQDVSSKNKHCRGLVAWVVYVHQTPAHFEQLLDTARTLSGNVGLEVMRLAIAAAGAGHCKPISDDPLNMAHSHPPLPSAPGCHVFCAACVCPVCLLSALSV